MIDQDLPHGSRSDAEKMILIDDAGFESLKFDE